MVCGEEFPEWDHNASYKQNQKGRSVDHIIPKSMDISKAEDKENLRIICLGCNKEKGMLTLDQMKKDSQSRRELNEHRFSMMLKK